MRKFAVVSLGPLVLAACGQPAADEPAAGPETIAAAMPPGDAASGQAAFTQCQSCHAIQPGQHGIGPSLHGAVGRPAGSAANFSYSSAMVQSDLNWDRETLNRYLEAPSAVVPGTAMVQAVPDPQTRSDIIAYLETLR